MRVCVCVCVCVRVCACERDPDSLVKALQPFVALTSAVGEEEVGAGAGQHVSVTCTQTHLRDMTNTRERLEPCPPFSFALSCGLLKVISTREHT